MYAFLKAYQESWMAVHNTHKGDVYFFSSMYTFLKAYQESWSKGRCKKGAPKV